MMIFLLWSFTIFVLHMNTFASPSTSYSPVKVFTKTSATPENIKYQFCQTPEENRVWLEKMSDEYEDSSSWKTLCEAILREDSDFVNPHCDPVPPIPLTTKGYFIQCDRTRAHGDLLKCVNCTTITSSSKIKDFFLYQHDAHNYFRLEMKDRRELRLHAAYWQKYVKYF